jgi:hypothetical protein
MANYQLKPEEIHRLANAMLECDCMSDPQLRDMVIEELENGIKNRIDRFPKNKQDVISIIRTCLSFTGGIENLLQRVESWEENSMNWQQLSIIWLEIKAQSNNKLSQDRLNQLQEILNQYTHLSEAVGHLYRSSYRGSAFAPKHKPNTLYEAFLRLFDLGEVKALAFLDRLVQQSGETVHQQPLYGWVTEAAHALEVSAELKQLREEAKSPVYLLIQLLPTMPQAETFTVQAWSWKAPDDCQTLETDEQPCQFPAVEQIVQRLLYEAEEKFETSDIVLELIFPRHLFSQDVLNWQVDVGVAKGTLARQYPVVLRWLDRFTDRRKHRVRWQDKWRATINLDCVNWDAHLKWLGCANECATTDVIDSLREPDCGVCLALGFVPPEKPDADDLLTAALGAGVPIALWFRHLLDNQSCNKQTFDDLLNGQKLTGLPRHIWNLRKNSHHDRTHSAYHLVLLYDDADRVPPISVTQAPRLAAT